MWIFLTVYAALYATLDLYVFTLFRRAFGPGRRVAVAFWCVAAVLMAAPVLGRMLDRADGFHAARAVSLIGDLGMLAVMWFLAGGLVADAWNLALRGIAVRWRGAARLILPYRAIVTGIALVTVALTAWGLHEAAHVRLTTVHMSHAGLPRDAAPVRVLQISDLHLGLMVRERALDRIAALIRQADPDLLLGTGDLLDSSAAHVTPLLARLSAVHIRGGKFAVLGNHEYYAGVQQSVALLQSAGFRVLRQERVHVRCGESDIVVAGVDYPAVRRMGVASRHDEAAALPDKAPLAFTILMKHLPVVAPASVGRFNLQLSGHTHGGQVFPFHFFVRLFYPRVGGYFDLRPGSALYISRGAGTWGPPVRVLAPPELTLFIISPVADAQP